MAPKLTRSSFLSVLLRRLQPRVALRTLPLRQVCSRYCRVMAPTSRQPWVPTLCSGSRSTSRPTRSSRSNRPNAISLHSAHPSSLGTTGRISSCPLSLSILALLSTTTKSWPSSNSMREALPSSRPFLLPRAAPPAVCQIPKASLFARSNIRTAGCPRSLTSTSRHSSWFALLTCRDRPDLKISECQTAKARGYPTLVYLFAYSKGKDCYLIFSCLYCALKVQSHWFLNGTCLLLPSVYSDDQ